MRIYYYLWSQDRPLLPIGGPYTSLKRLATAVKRARPKHPQGALLPRRIVQGRWYDLNEVETEALLAMLSG